MYPPYHVAGRIDVAFTLPAHHASLVAMNITASPGTGVVHVAPGLIARSPVRAQIEECNGYDLELEVVAVAYEAGRAGRFVCQELTVRQREGGPPVSLAGIRRIPVAELTNRAGKSYVMEVVDVQPDGSLSAVPLEMPEDVAAHGPTDTALRWVAHVYRLAVVVGDPPAKAVREAMGIPVSTAGRWVAIARKRGFLGAADGPGKAGG